MLREEWRTSGAAASNQAAAKYAGAQTRALEHTTANSSIVFAVADEAAKKIYQQFAIPGV